MSFFEIDPDIRRARTLPSEFYTDPDHFELSISKIFARSWQFLGKSDELNGVTPAVILPGLLDEPVIIIRQADDISCRSNVCTHRGMILVDKACTPNLIKCGYHGRRFSLDGKFLSMPEFQDVEGFPSADDDLKKVPFGLRAGFMFAAVNPVVPFEEFLYDAAVWPDEVEAPKLRLTETRQYNVNAHWALYCENYLEGFHIPFVHRALNEVVDYGSYTTDTFRYTSLQTGKDAKGRAVARYLFIFPNIMFNFYDWGISVNVVRPVGPAETVVEFLTYLRDGSVIGPGPGDDLHRVETEDEAVVESVQRGIRSRFYSQGRYSPTREQGTHLFHRLIAEFMA